MQGEKLAETLGDAQSELLTGKGAAMMLLAAQKTLARSAFNSEGGFTR